MIILVQGPCQHENYDIIHILRLYNTEDASWTVNQPCQVSSISVQYVVRMLELATIPGRYICILLGADVRP